MFLVTLLYALFASVFTISKSTLEYTQPLFLVGSRMSLAGLAILLYVLLIQKEKIVFTRSLVLRLLALGFCNIWLVNALEYWGLKHLTSFKTCFIYSLSPFVSALLSYFIFKETLSFKKWVGFTIGILGFIPILTATTTAEEAMGQLWVFSWPEIYVIGAAVFSCYGWILLRELIQVNQVSPLFANGASMLVGGLLATIHSYLTEAWNPIPVTETLPFLQGAIALMIVSNFVAYNLYGHLLKRFTATFISFAGFTTPIFTALFGVLFLQETITWPFALSSCIVFVGLFLFNQEELKEGIRAGAKT